jgi:sugar/nucleoside kinase (ribokinase family)
MSFDVTLIGEIYLDHVFSGFAGWPEPGAEIFTEEYQWELGGGAVNTACALARLGRSVQLIGVVGREQIDAIERRLAHFGVSADFLMLSAKQTGVTVSVSIADERTLFSYRGANDSLLQRLQETPALLAPAAASRHVHLAMPLPATSISTVLRAIQARGATTSLDVGHHVEWLKDGASAEVMRSVDYLFPNAKEAHVMQGGVAEYLRFCRDLGCNAVVKLGAAGAVMLADGRELRVSPPSVRVVDTTGAGDAFDAGFLDGLLDELSPRECLELGCMCGALSTRAAGSLEALPTREQIAFAKESHVA